MRQDWVHMFITHRPTLTLQHHNFDLFRTCRTSSFCTVAWQLWRFQLTWRIARSLSNSWASCYHSVPPWLQMNNLNLDFSRDVAISFFCRNSTMTGDRHMVRGKENIGHFVFCRMAPSVMTSGDPGSQNCFWFALLLWVRFAQKVCNRSLPFFSAGGRHTGVNDFCEIWLLSLKGRCYGNKFWSF